MTYVYPSDEIINRPIIQKLIPYFNQALEFGTTPSPHKAVLTTIAQEGWTIRVLRSGSGHRSTALMWLSSGGNLIFHTYTKFNEYLPACNEIIKRLAVLIRELGYNDIEAGKRAYIPENEVIDNIDKFGPLLYEIAASSG